MSPPASPSPWRGIRTLGAAIASVSAALAAHGVAGGDVSPIATAWLLVGAVGVAAAITTRRVSTSQILGLLVLCQATVHLTSAPTHPTVGGWTMLAGHLAATVVCAVLLTRAERWAWGLADALTMRVLRRPGTILVPVVVDGPVPTPGVRLCSALLERLVLVRGPPVEA